MGESEESLAKMGLAVPSRSVSFAPHDPMMRGSSFCFCRVLFRVAPVAQTLEVFERVVHVVAVFVMHLATPRFAASFARTVWL